MKISWNHLSQLVNLESIEMKDVASKLTLAGFEVENIKYIERIKDTILDVNITANRQDLKGWAQIAIELSATLKRPLITVNNLPNMKLMHFSQEPMMPLADVYACIIDIQSALYHNNAHEYLKAFGLNHTGGILDVVDFINLKWGQSIKAYKIQEKEFASMQDLKIDIDQLSQDIKNNAYKIYIKNQELTQITRENELNPKSMLRIILISCSHQYQDGKYYPLSNQNNLYRTNAYSEIISTLGHHTKDGEKSWELYHWYHNSKELGKTISVSMQDINRVLGPRRTKEENSFFIDLHSTLEIIKNLQLEARYINGIIKITIPPERADDITSKIDIAEEIARIYGFNKFYDTIPRFNTPCRFGDRKIIKQKIRKILRSMGLHEVINYSLRSEIRNNENLNIVNPLSQEQEVLRRNIISSIIESKEYNNRQDNSTFEAFEIGNIFFKDTCSKKYQESLHLGCILENKNFNKSNWQTNASSLTWLQAKGHAEELLERMNAKISWCKEINDNKFIRYFQGYIHSKNKVYIMSDLKPIGVLSEVNYLADKNSNNSAYFLEINITKLAKAIQRTNHLKYIYQQYSSYPKITRDFSIQTKASMEEIRKTIAEILIQGRKTIESIVISSEYYNSQNEKTICLRATYQSKKKTLTSKEVEILDKIIKVKMDAHKYIKSRT